MAFSVLRVKHDQRDGVSEMDQPGGRGQCPPASDPKTETASTTTLTEMATDAAAADVASTRSSDREALKVTVPG